MEREEQTKKLGSPDERCEHTPNRPRGPYEQAAPYGRGEGKGRNSAWTVHVPRTGILQAPHPGQICGQVQDEDGADPEAHRGAPQHGDDDPLVGEEDLGQVGKFGHTGSDGNPDNWWHGRWRRWGGGGMGQGNE